MLVVGTYGEAGAAADDFKALKAGEDAGEYQVVGAVVLNRDAERQGRRAEHGDGRTSRAAPFSAAPPGSWSGCSRRRCLRRPRSEPGSAPVVGKLKKKHEEKQLGVEMEEYLPPGSSAVVAVVDDVYADKVEAALVNSDKRINKAIDKDDYDELQKAIAESSDEVTKAVNS